MSGRALERTEKSYVDLLEEWVDTFRSTERMPYTGYEPVEGRKLLWEELSSRIDHIAEENSELYDAVWEDSFVGVADALADIVYVCLEIAVLLDLPFDEVFREIHRANMTKLGEDGNPIIKNGKVQKGPNYVPPDIVSIIAGDAYG